MSMEFKALRRSSAKFFDAADPSFIISNLHTNGLLTRWEWQKARQTTLTPNEQLAEVWEALQRRVSVDPSVFHKVVKILRDDPAQKLLGDYMQAMYEGNDKDEGEREDELHQSGAPANDTHCDAEIDDSNLIDVLEELHPVAHMWKAIGEALRCPEYELKQIERSHTNYDQPDFLREMLIYRMAQLDPSRLKWSGIVKALRARTVGNVVLANKIAEKFCPAAVIKEKRDKPQQSPPSTESSVVLQRKKASPTNGKTEESATGREEINVVDLTNEGSYSRLIVIVTIGCVTVIVVFLLLHFNNGKD